MLPAEHEHELAAAAAPHELAAVTAAQAVELAQSRACPAPLAPLEPPPETRALKSAERDKILAKLRRDLLVDSGLVGSAALVLAGLALPVRVLDVVADGDTVTVDYVCESALLPAGVHLTNAIGGPGRALTEREADVVAALAPALAAWRQGGALQLPAALLEAARVPHPALAIVRGRHARLALGWPVARLDHVRLAAGGTLEEWVRKATVAETEVAAMCAELNAHAQAAVQLAQRIQAACLQAMLA